MQCACGATATRKIKVGDRVQGDPKCNRCTDRAAFATLMRERRVVAIPLSEGKSHA